MNTKRHLELFPRELFLTSEITSEGKCQVRKLLISPTLERKSFCSECIQSNLPTCAFILDYRNLRGSFEFLGVRNISYSISNEKMFMRNCECRFHFVIANLTRRERWGSKVQEFRRRCLKVLLNLNKNAGLPLFTTYIFYCHHCKYQNGN